MLDDVLMVKAHTKIAINNESCVLADYYLFRFNLGPISPFKYDTSYSLIKLCHQISQTS